MIAAEQSSSRDRELALPALLADRILFLVAVAAFVQLSLPGSPSSLSSMSVIFVLQAVCAFGYNGRKMWKINRKLTRRQTLSTGIVALATILQLAMIFSPAARLGIFQTAVVYFFFEVLLELTPLFDVVQKAFLSSRLSPVFAGRRRGFQPRAKTAVALICLSFSVICLFTGPSPERVTDQDQANNEKGKASLATAFLPNFQVFFANLQAVICVCISSAIGFVLRGFMSGGIRATGFSSLRRAYGIYLCLAAAVMMSLNLAYLLFYRSDKAGRDFKSSYFLFYPLAAMMWFLFNSPSRERKPASRSLIAFVVIVASCFLFRLVLRNESVWSFSEMAVALLSGGSVLALTTTSVITFRIDALLGPNELRSIFRHVMERQTTRKIFIFLCMNFTFTFVEVLYGYWTNSIGLISDAVHMLFDCTALAIGLYASYVSRLKENDDYPFGYGRFEVVSGYINGIFLVFISFSVFVESVERLFDPPDIEGSEIFVVAVLGLFVNIIGLIFFRDAHSHSHGADGCHNHNSNMQGIYLHVLADALGSVGVIISSLLVHFFNFTIADPICSLIIAVLILASVMNLLKDTSLVLLQRSPPDVDKTVPKIVNRILSMDGVIGLRDLHMWSFRSDQRISSVCVHVDSNCDGRAVLSDIKTIFRKLGMLHTSVQIETDEFVSRLEPEVRTRYRRVESVLQGPLELEEIPTPTSHSHSHSHSHCDQFHQHGHSIHGHSHQGDSHL